MNVSKRRLFDHVTLRVSNLERSKQFYQAVIETLGHTISDEASDRFCIDELFVTQNTVPSQSMHLSFQAENPATVKLFYETALQSGGKCQGAPKERALNSGYYAACVMDPDGNSIEAIYKSRTISY